MRGFIVHKNTKYNKIINTINTKQHYYRRDDGIHQSPSFENEKDNDNNIA